MELAARGRGHVSPNPLVGAVVVHNGEIIGEGWHERYGEPHAEVNAVRDAETKGHSVEGSDCYVTLEPCSHFGKRPPCSDLLIEKKIARCVIAMRDPYHEVDGRGISKLEAAGIAVEVGLLESDAREQNRFFIKHVTEKLPYVTMKIGQSIDGRSALANGESKWITGEASRKRVHELRAQFDAVLIGSGTAIADDPELTVRSAEGRNPKRIVLDREAKLSLKLKIFNGEAEIIRLVAQGLKEHEFDLEVAVKDGKLLLNNAIKQLSNLGIASILIEAGPRLAASVIQEGLADELLFFTAPIVLGGDAQPAIGNLGFESLSQPYRWTLRATELFEGGDILSIYRRSLT